MNIIQVLKSENPQIFQAVGRLTGMNESELENVVNEIMPAFSKGVKTATKDETKAHEFFDTLDRDNSQLTRYLERPEDENPDEVKHAGESFLSLIFGDKEVSRNVAKKVSEKTGVQDTNIKQSLPYLATAVMSVFNQMYNKQGFQGQALKGDKETDSGLNNLLLEFFDADKDGSILDDLVGMLGKYFGHGETRH